MNLGEVVRELEVEPVQWPQVAPAPQEAPAQPAPVEREPVETPA